MSGNLPPRRRILHGIVQLARGRPHGLSEFGNDANSIIGSLIPLLALLLVGGAIELAAGPMHVALRDMAMLTIALITPAIVSHVIAMRLNRTAYWPRFITAYNWCQWALPAVALCILLAASLLSALGLPQAAAAQLALLALLGYALWLQWNLVRFGLLVAGGMAVGIVLLMNGVTAGLIVAPRLVGALLG
jgi:hypothetical protein